ncbi:MAG: polysaccharide biosynthesis protein [Clostridia bacterium]|nr:polysaccharide biosynthesis protein [Clostridia bacterium]
MNHTHNINKKKNSFWSKLFGRKGLLILVDGCCLLVAYAIVAFISSSFGVPTKIEFDLPKYVINVAIFAFYILLMRAIFKSYSNVSRYANSKSYISYVFADVSAGILGYVTVHFVDASAPADIGLLNSVCVIALFDLATLVSRFLYQQLYQRHNANEFKGSNKIGVAIVGAGQVGALLAEELTYKRSHYKPLCFIDRDPEKIGGRVCGLKVFAENDDVADVVKRLDVQEIFIAIDSMTSKQTKEMHERYSRTGCKVKIYDFPMKDATSSGLDAKRRVIREIKIEDLLFRDAHKIDIMTIAPYYHGKTVLVTGGGGSIGSELCRQIAKCSPKKLIILDIYENNAYDIQQKLIRKYGDELDLAVEIASVRDIDRLDCVFANYRPDVVFHAAAHKHVPLMEHSSCEAIKNNVIGTYNTANMAEKYGVSKFILVSTDKAVNPTNIMGASKRMCEMVIQCRTDSRTSFSAVRFGNVLGSNGSVIPLFREQITAGGPITLTDKRIIRYFMTIPEASQLVMQAGAMAKSGELFVLDMGRPIKILDMAENMIRLAGLQPYNDIDIVEIGLRPGEKLYEELLIKTETLDKTDNELIFIEKDAPLTRDEVERRIGILREAVERNKDKLEASDIKAAMMQVVPTYHEPEEVNRKAYKSDEMRSANTPDSEEKVLVNA